MTIRSLIDFIDRHTNNGTIYPSEPWGEGVEVEVEGIAHSYIHFLVAIG